jgi:hypothetical protein
LKAKNIKLMYSAMLCAVLAPFVLLACSESSVESSDIVMLKDPPSAGPVQASLPAHEHCEAVVASVRDAGFEDEAWVTCDAGHAYIHSDSFPDHEVMKDIVGAIEQMPLPAPGYFAPIKFNPAFYGAPQTRDSSLAVAVNGIPIFDYSAGGELTLHDLYHYQPQEDTILRKELDPCGGHTGRGDDYHYHELPRCMIEQMDNKDENPIIGWGFDGFPMYGNDNPDGSAIATGTLDVCNGQLDPVFGYRYHTSDEYPYIIQCLVGEVGDLRAVPSIGLSSVDGGARRPASDPVFVENMTFTYEESGEALITYELEGESYFIGATPTETEGCFYYSWDVIGNERGSGPGEGEYCHVIRNAGMGAP